MTQPWPDVSVVVPTFRNPELLPRLIAALEQQSLDAAQFEVLVVDDGSGDETPDVLRELAASSPLRLRPILLEANVGPAAARNVGWRAAMAPIVAFTDDDCRPEPEWLRCGLATIRHDPAIGIVQGCTLMPRGDYDWNAWTVYREIREPTPWFEACNLFIRREALEQTSGFCEEFRKDWEDTWLGWAVLAAGWQRAFDELAVVRHDLSERGLSFHIRMAWRERLALRVAREFPDLQRHGFWRPWTLRPQNAAFAVGLVGTVLAKWRPIALTAWLPWWWLYRPPRGFHPYFRFFGERLVVDATSFAAMKVGAVQNWRFAL